MKPLLVAVFLVGLAGCADLKATAGAYARANAALLHSYSEAIKSGDFSQFVYSAPTGANQSTAIYQASQCVGAVVNYECHGTIVAPAPVGYCHGQMIGGQCTGPVLLNP